jgi:hypothetical protein
MHAGPVGAWPEGVWQAGQHHWAVSSSMMVPTCTQHRWKCMPASQPGVNAVSKSVLPYQDGSCVSESTLPVHPPPLGHLPPPLSNTHLCCLHLQDDLLQGLKTPALLNPDSSSSSSSRSRGAAAQCVRLEQYDLQGYTKQCTTHASTSTTAKLYCTKLLENMESCVLPPHHLAAPSPPPPHTHKQPPSPVDHLRG